VDLTHRFGHRGSAHFDNGIEYLCCCTKPTKTAMVCEVVPADSPSKHWFRSGCPAILGDDYQSFLETLKDDSFKGARNRGRCVVPHSPFAQLTTGPERLVPFSRVVRQAEVVEAVRQSFPALDVNYTVMTLATAERFFYRHAVQVFGVEDRERRRAEVCSCWRFYESNSLANGQRQGTVDRD